MSRVTVTVEDRIAHVELTRADKLNAIDEEMFVALDETSARVRDDEDLAAIVLSGAGRSFSAGLDFSMHASFADEGSSGLRPYADPDDPAATGQRRPGRGQRIVSAFRDAHAPVIAALHGHVIGGAMQIALGADIRVVAPDARLGLREIDFGMTVDMGASQLLPRLIGTDRALDLLLTGRLLSGEEAVAWGLATRVSDDPLADALATARGIAERSPTAVKESKRLVQMSQTATLAEGFHEELRVMSANIGSPDQVAATQRYLARRKEQ